MDRLSLLDETLRAFDSALPRVVRSRCVATRYRASACRRCAEACPAGAITVAPLNVDADLCIACGACASACRTGALDYPQPRAGIHECLSRPGGGEVVVACSRAEAGEAGAPPDVVIACLAGLSATEVVAAAAAGREKLVLVSGDCENCVAKGPLVDRDLGASPTAAWLDVVGSPLTLRRVTTTSGGAPLQPPAASVTRRGLFGLLMGRGRVAAAAALASPTPRIEDIHAVTPPPAAHRRLFDDLKAMSSLASRPSLRLPDDLPIAAVTAGRDCDGCALCTRYCPHGALAVVEDTLVGEIGRCTGCGLCAEMCPRGALSVEAVPVAVLEGRVAG